MRLVNASQHTPPKACRYQPSFVPSSPHAAVVSIVERVVKVYRYRQRLSLFVPPLKQHRLIRGSVTFVITIVTIVITYAGERTKTKNDVPQKQKKRVSPLNHFGEIVGLYAPLWSGGPPESS